MLYAASCSGISLGGLKWFLCVQAGEGRSCEHFGGEREREMFVVHIVY